MTVKNRYLYSTLLCSHAEDFHIIRALGAEEMNATTVSRTAMDWLGHKMEKEGIGKYFPNPLRKIKPVRAIKRLSKTEREIELEVFINLNQ